ncbi:MAG: cell division protein ZapA [Sneathiella sp.]
MSSVTVKVNGRPYPIICGDGEEDHVTYLAEFVDKKVQDLSGMSNTSNESQLLLMAALLVADDLSQAYETIDELKGKTSETPRVQLDTENWANRLEAIADRLEKA